MNEIKTPPNNVEAEKAVLGAVLLDAVNKTGDKVIDICLSSGVNADTFFDPRNKIVYSTMLAMNRASKPLDAITLMDELRTTEKFETIGGTGYIQSLIDTVESTANAQYYITMIKAKHLRRRMIDTAKNVVDKCYDEKEYSDPQAILGEAESSFLEIGNKSESTMPWSAAVEDSFRRIDKMFSSRGKSFEGLSTGLTHLDEKLQGLKPSEMIVVAARPSVGKTSLAMNIAESVALGRDMNGVPVKTDGGKMHPVMIFSLEMPVEALSKRMVSGRAGIDMWKLNRGLCAQREKDDMTNRLFQAVAELKAAPIIVDDAANLDVADLRARARRAKKSHNIELIVIDYLQLCRCDDKSKQGRQLEVAAISQQIKAMAKELKIPVIVLSQLSRANEQRGDKYEKPKLSDLRDSGAIEQDADVVFLLRRPSRNSNDPESNDQTLAIIDVAKNRNGETGEVRVNFIRELTRFCDREIPRSEDSNFTSSEIPPEPGEEFVQDPLM
jgi:replicative DNA helicase